MSVTDAPPATVSAMPPFLRTRSWVIALWAIAVVFGAVAPAGAEDPLTLDPVFDDPGALPGSEIAAIAQDRSGFLWLATDGGLVRWDGARARTVGADPDSSLRLPQFAVSDVATDPVHGVWAAAGELVYVDTWRASTKSLGVHVDRIVADGAHLWAVGSSGVYRVNSATHTAERVASGTGVRRDRRRISIATDAAGALYIAQEWGVRIVDRSGVERSVVIPEGTMEVARRRRGGVWATSASGLWRVVPPQGARSVRVAAADDLAGALVERADRSVVVARRGGGVYSFAPRDPGLKTLNVATNRRPVSRSQIASLFVDSEGRLWAAREGAGLYGGVARERTGIQQLALPGAPRGAVSGIHRLGETIWVASGGSLRGWDPSTRRWSHNFSQPDLDSSGTAPEIVGIATAPGGLWVADSVGYVGVLDPGSGRYTVLPYLAESRIVGLVSGPGNAPWVLLAGRGLEMLDTTGRPTRRLGPAGDVAIQNLTPRAVLAEGDALLVGGDAGLERVQPDSGRVEIWSSRDGDLVGETVYDIVPAQNGAFWLATSAGLEWLDLESGAHRYFGRSAGLPSTRVYQVRPHPAIDALWLATGRGIALFDIARGETVLTDVPSGEPQLGVLDAAGSATGADGNEIYFGGRGGLTVVEPRAGVGRALTAPIEITAMYVDNRQVDASQTQRVPRGSVVRFEFGVATLSDPGGIAFRYRLDGSVDRWEELPIGERSVTFADLAPGDHRFDLEARALGTDRVVSTESGSEARAGISFSLPEPWWSDARILAAAAVLLVALGAAAGRLGVLRARRRAQELERIVSRRTHELATSAEAAERANASKSRFLAMISHELRSPLHAVLGYTEMISETSDDPTVSDWATSARSAGGHVAAMIEDLLVVAREGELSRAEPPQSVELESFLHETVDICVRARDARCQVVVETHNVAPVYRFPLGRVRQLLVNLIDNAIKHCESAVVVEVVGRAPIGAHAPELRFTVSDDGPGIPSEVRENLFEPFVRGSQAREAGLGLGLAICADLAQGLGADLSAETGADGRSRFRFDLPAEVGEAIEASPAGDGSGASVLVVDDEELSRTVLADHLGLLNFRVAVAASGQEALALLESTPDPPNILLTDHFMPGMSGAGLAAAVRDRPALDGMPIIAVTAAPEEADGVRWYDEVVAKPVSRDALLRALIKHCPEVLPDESSSTPAAVPRAPSGRG